MSLESITGYREAYDFAISLRTKYPQLFTPGSPVHVFANDYPRVVETAQNFLRAYLGVNASHGPNLGTVYAVNSTGSSNALGNSLAPSDLCPDYVDDSGVNETTIWNALYQPAIVKRLQNYIKSGSLNLTTTDIATMQYLCGFETSIRGTISPFSNVFTAQEFQAYEYTQDLRYYYGNGPGSATGKYMMFPFLLSLTDLLATYSPTATSNTTTTKIQPLTISFLNDGQISQLASQLGIFDSEPALPSTWMPQTRKYITSHFISMRGTITFERLSCPSSSSPSSSKFLRIRLNDAI
ncbi:putative histidine acid [Phaeomoniella chlamydospora]|uniref:Putative histidine acid n=1 Tax=Phaeomoniella chlamydospora TaxID=158046 RepID=A0A0G2GGH1_PHACM|nr:putative histidine acid [Phaeomoniella chlamydospora]